MPRKKKEEAPVVEEIRIEDKRIMKTWTEKNNAMQDKHYGGKEK